jgi:hypothetical protein
MPGGETSHPVVETVQLNCKLLTAN